MVVVAGLWELGWSTPIKEAEHWEHLLRDFGVDGWHMVPVSGIRNQRVEELGDMGEVLDLYPGLETVFVDEGGVMPLREFSHPEEALYVLGKSRLRPMTSYARPGSWSVRVETPRNLGLLWPHQALAVVLYDRMLKGGLG